MPLHETLDKYGTTQEFSSLLLSSLSFAWALILPFNTGGKLYIMWLCRITELGLNLNFSTDGAVKSRTCYLNLLDLCFCVNWGWKSFPCCCYVNVRWRNETKDVMYLLWCQTRYGWTVMSDGYNYYTQVVKLTSCPFSLQLVSLLKCLV